MTFELKPLNRPLATRCTNSGVYDRWTCPACYTDFATKTEGVESCPSCGRKSSLSLDYDPVCVAVLVDEEDVE